MADTSAAGSAAGRGACPARPSTLSTPLPAECLACYVWRMLGDCGCNATLRWTRGWRDARAPRATALEQQLARRGGCCDCQLFLNVWTTSGSRVDPDTLVVDYQPPSGLCAGVRRGSSKPCAQWRVSRP